MSRFQLDLSTFGFTSEERSEFPGMFAVFGDSFVHIPGHAILVHQRVITEFFASEYAVTNPAILWITDDVTLPPGSQDRFPASLRKGGFDRLNELIACPFGLRTEQLANEWQPDYAWGTTFRSMTKDQVETRIGNSAWVLNNPHLAECSYCRSRFYEAVCNRATRLASNYCLLVNEIEALAETLWYGKTEHYAWEHTQSCLACRLLLRDQLTSYYEELIDNVNNMLGRLSDAVGIEIRMPKPGVEVEIRALPTSLIVRFVPKQGPLQSIWPIKGLMLTSTNMKGDELFKSDPWRQDNAWPFLEISRREGDFAYYLNFR